MRFVACSDLHLDFSTHGVSRFGEVRDGMLEAARRAIRDEVDAFLFAGDLCDPDSGSVVFRCVAAAIEVAEMLAEAKVPSIWLAGNHDRVLTSDGDTTLSPLAQLRGTTYVAEEPGSIDVADCAVACFPFPAPNRAYDALALAREEGALARKRGKKVVFLSHLNIPGMELGEESAEMARGKEHFLPKEATDLADLVVQGHFHRPRRVGNVVVVGSMARLTFGEEGAGKPGYLVGEV